MKECTECHNLFPPEDFTQGPNTAARCKKCRRARHRETARLRKEQGLTRPQNRVFTDPDTGIRMKKCAECGETLVLTNFGRQGLHFRKTCRPCTRLVQARRYSENPEYFRKASREWAARNPEKAKAKYRKWEETGGKEWRAEYQRRPEIAERRRENERKLYQAMSPEERSAYNRREYERYDNRSYMMAYRCLADSRVRVDGEPVIRPEDVIKVADVIERDGMTCYLCDESLAPEEITIDHVIPIARGGAHTPDNLRVCCQPCNSRKGTKLLSELQL